MIQIKIIGKKRLSIFDNKILIKKQLLFLIEYRNGNIIEDYIYEIINEIDEYITDSKIISLFIRIK